MARRASSSVHPAWFGALAAIVVAAGALIFFLKGKVQDPYRGLTTFPVAEYLRDSNSLRGNTYQVDGVIGDQIGYAEGARLCSVEVGDDRLGVLFPASLRELNIQKGQHYVLKIEVAEKGILRAIEAKKL